MHYLECITLLNYLLEKLKAEQRTQVPTSVCNEIMSVLMQIQKKLEHQGISSEVLATIQDLYVAADDARKAPGILFLPESMKNVLVNGLKQLRHTLNIIAYRYFQRNDTIPDTPTAPMVTVLREVVTDALKEGLL